MSPPCRGRRIALPEDSAGLRHTVPARLLAAHGRTQDSVRPPSPRSLYAPQRTNPGRLGALAFSALARGNRTTHGPRREPVCPLSGGDRLVTFLWPALRLRPGKPGAVLVCLFFCGIVPGVKRRSPVSAVGTDTNCLGGRHPILGSAACLASLLLVPRRGPTAGRHEDPEANKTKQAHRVLRYLKTRV
jgi:hypothetical protein